MGRCGGDGVEATGERVQGAHALQPVDLVERLHGLS
jgi:hypothetical protein